MAVPQDIVRLIERYNAQREAYESGQYKETEIRVEFIDPFFKALGWDVHNEQGYAEAYKDVIHEEALKIGGATEAPDSCFRIGGARKFFVECKKPSVNIKDAPHPAYQLRRYGWSAKLPLSILTDFEEFAVYDCRVKPTKNDSSAVGRILYLTSRQYAEKWDEIAAIFSREAVLKGSFDKFAENTKGKRGTASVDDAFLEEIERWRDLLARNIAMRNPELSQRELNFAVQRTIDRIIFLRICEDRGIEPYGRLMTLRNGERVYPRLCEFFERADERYNSGIFCFAKNSSATEPPDELTLKLKIDDKALRDVFANLYYPESPYEFSVLSADILGQVYERFLGKVIRLTAGHQAKVEEKPEVRKAGGVYYTPTFIVDYIVKNTVGKLLEGQTPKQVAKLKILDPACGSGSFLLGAYQHLLDWHRDFYVKEQEKADAVHKAASNRARSARSTPIYQGPGGDWRLTTEERKRILLNNIFGVDIDSQAVEVTKLSLLLKVLEGESQESITKQYELFHQRALPDLGSNIKCGNSLIGPDAYRHQQLTLLPEEDRYRINVFDWQRAFPEVFGRAVSPKSPTGGALADPALSGFDAIIGNPPYIRIPTMKEWAPAEVELYKTLFQSARVGNYDIYVVFVEKALSLLNKSGRLGFILPHKFFNAQYGAALRGIIAGGKHLAHVVYFGDQQVFTGATTYTCLLFLDKKGSEECHFVRVDDLDAWRMEQVEPTDRKVKDVAPMVVHEAAALYRAKGKKITPTGAEGHIPARVITSEEWNFSVGATAKVFDTLNKWPEKLDDISKRMAQGIRTSANEVYVLDLIRESDNTIIAHSKILGRDVKLERNAVSLFLQGREIKPYRVLPSGKVVIVPYTIQNGRAVLIPEGAIQKRFPLLHAYLIENKDYLSAREKDRMRGPNWYAYVYPKNIDVMQNPKILVPDIADRASFALDEGGNYTFTSGYGITLRPDVKESPKYILALLNSSVLDFYLKRISTTMRGGFFRYFTQFIERLPIRRIDFSKPSEKAEHDRLVSLVDQISTLYKQATAAKSPPDKETLDLQLHAATQQIDRLVYELYGLTEEEIRIVEESAQK